MKMKTWISVILIGQAIAFLPYRILFDDIWLHGSLILAGIGVIVFIFSRHQKNAEYEDNWINPDKDSEYSGAQVLNLLDKMDHDDRD
jgi:hypothetical protein